MSTLLALAVHLDLLGKVLVFTPCESGRNPRHGARPAPGSLGESPALAVPTHVLTMGNWRRPRIPIKHAHRALCICL